MADEERKLYSKMQRQLVGALLADSDAMNRVLELVNEDDIEEPAYALVFSAMAALSRSNKEISVVSVAEKLQNEGNLKAAGGTVGLYSLLTEGEGYRLESIPEGYARIVKEASAKAKVSKTLSEALKDFQDDSGVQASDAITEVQSVLNEQLLKLSDTSTITKFADELDHYNDLLEERRKVSEENADANGLQGIPSLLPSMNEYTTGWLPEQLITVGAKTGVGKSVYAVNCAIAAAQAGKSVMFFSLEMSSAELQDRIVSAVTSVPMKKYRHGQLSEEERAIFDQQFPLIKEMKIAIDVEPKQTIDSIKARALRQAQSPEGLDFIIVDYLQLVTPAGRFNSRQEAVADMSRNMKIFAKQLKVPIMQLVQLNRSKDEDSDLPNLDQIRESGAIAQDSDIVILLHRETDHKSDTIPPTVVLLEKNRNGENKKIIRCHSNLACSMLREIPSSKKLKDGESALDEELSEEDLALADEDDDLEDFDDFDLEEALD